jgi:hypothetical protein
MFFDAFLRRRPTGPLLRLARRIDLSQEAFAEEKHRIRALLEEQKESGKISPGCPVELFELFLRDTRCARAAVYEPELAINTAALREKLEKDPRGLEWRYLLEEGLAFAVEENGSAGIAVSDAALAFMPRTRLARLGLLGEASISLSIERKGVLLAPDFDIRLRWLRNRALLQRPGLDGIYLTAGKKSYLLAPTYFIAADAVSRFREEKAEGREIAFAKLSEVLRVTGVGNFSGAATTVRLLFASQFSLTIDPETKEIVPYFLPNALNPEGERKDYRPLLSAREMKRALSQLKADCDDGKSVPEYFAVGSSSFVYLAPSLRRTLGVVQRLRSGAEGPEGKFELMANPLSAIMRHWPKGEPQPEIDGIFVETPEFLSSRVKAFGPWTPKRIDFIKPASTDWFASGGGDYVILVNGEPCTLTAEECRSLRINLEKALKEGGGSVRIKNEEFSTDAFDREEIEALVDAIDKAQEVTGKQDEKSPEERPAGKDSGAPSKTKEEKPKKPLYGPLIKDNLEVLSYECEKAEPRGWSTNFAGLEKPYALLDHQKEALSWLQGLWNAGVPGALLADDMGLGKTLQCLAFMKWLRDGFAAEGEAKPMLVLAPVSLLSNWQQEAQKYFGPGLTPPLIADGRTAAAAERRTPSEVADALASTDWVISNYETVVRHPRFFMSVGWGFVALDEAQKIKTPTSLTTETVKALKSDFVLAMTGTPVENSFADLWSILDACVPGLMGSLRSFAERYGGERDPEQSGRELQGLLTGEGMQGKGVCLMLRRLKIDRLKGLPSKNIEKVRVPMPPQQLAKYRSCIADYKNHKGTDGRQMLFKALSAIRRCSVVPFEVSGEEVTLLRVLPKRDA